MPLSLVCSVTRMTFSGAYASTKDSDRALSLRINKSGYNIHSVMAKVLAQPNLNPKPYPLCDAT